MNTYGIIRTLLAVVGLAIAGIATFALVDRAVIGERAAERRALLARDAELTRMALAPGSALPCLDGAAGETVENSCEKRVFATAQGTAAAVSYMDARLKLLADVARLRDPGALGLLAASRRAIALDRYGLAAHVLAIRDACTADKCDAFALVDDASALKANLRAQVYDQYVSRYVAAWSEPSAPADKPAAVSAVPTAPFGAVTASGQTAIPAVKPGEHWDFPSAASIPAVSIMGAEPPMPKGAEAQAQAQAKPATNAKAPAPSKTPLPQAAPPAAR